MSIVITKAEQITPKWITTILQREGTITRTTSVTDIQLNSEQMRNCTVYYLTLKYNHAVSTSVPHRLFLKLPTSNIDETGTEVEFYKTIVPIMQNSSVKSWPFLRCYDAVWSVATGQVHFLFEDLSSTHFTTNDLMPPTQKHCEQVIDSYAHFHAFWWEHPKLGQEIGQFLTNEMIDGFITGVQTQLEQLTIDMKEDLAENDYDILKRVASAWPGKRRDRVVQGKGVTLVHRDPHPGNFLYPKHEKDGVVKLIDWQSWRVDTGTDDLAYLMAFHWPLEARIQTEFNLVKRYYYQLMAGDVADYTWDDCYYDYQASIIRCLSFLIMSWSPAQQKRLERGLEAFKHWRCAELLAN